MKVLREDVQAYVRHAWTESKCVRNSFGVLGNESQGAFLNAIFASPR